MSYEQACTCTTPCFDVMGRTSSAQAKRSPRAKRYPCPYCGELFDRPCSVTKVCPLGHRSEVVSDSVTFHSTKELTLGRDVSHLNTLPFVKGNRRDPKRLFVNAEVPSRLVRTFFVIVEGSIRNPRKLHPSDQVRCECQYDLDGTSCASNPYPHTPTDWLSDL
jgi:hypothetical protein